MVAYDGTDFAGFQRQAGPDGVDQARTVQGELERALTALYGEHLHNSAAPMPGRVVVRGAGRTDAGVHARGQVIAWDAPPTVPAERLPLALRGLLPADVAVRACQVAESTFDPRRDAVSRVYRYTLVWDPLPDPMRDRYVTRLDASLEPAGVDRVRAAAARLVGEHEFAGFCCRNGQTGSTRRHLRRLDVLTWCADSAGGLARGLVLELEADGFLYKQVRTTVGLLLAIGRGRFEPALVTAMLAGQPRPAQVAVAPPTGLVLERVVY